MADLVQRPYTSADLPGLRELWRRVYEEDSIPRREAAFQWVTRQHPYCPDGSPRHLVMDGERVAGALGRLPVPFLADGQPLDMHFSHDLLVDPAYRGQGLGKILVKAVAEAAPSMAGGLWMTDPCYALHQRSGWKVVSPWKAHGLVLDAGALLRRRLGNGLLARFLRLPADAYIRLFQRGTGKASLAVSEVERFPATVDGLAAAATPSLGLVARREKPYLDWKFFASPHLNYRRFLLGPPDSPRAYVVTRLDRRPDGRTNGQIIDFLLHPEDHEALTSVMAVAVDSLRDQGAEVVYCLTTHAAFRDRLEAMGFRPTPRLQTFVVTGQPPPAVAAGYLQSKAWYLTFSDSDGDMWSGAQTWKIHRDSRLPAATVPS